MATAAVNAPVGQLCFGSGSTELNLREVQRRVSELIKIIDSLLVDMQTHGAHWKGFLDKLAVINMVHQQIMMELRPLLRQYTVYPKFVDTPGIENALPEMLASRLLPEQVDQEAAWKACLPGGLAQLAAQPRTSLEYADNHVAELREMVGWLTSLQHYVKEAAVNPTPRGLPVGLLDPKSDVRRAMEATTRQIVLAASAAEKGREQAGTALIESAQPVAPPPPQKRQRVDASGRATPPPAAAIPVPSNEAEADSLISKVLSGELWPAYKTQ